MFALTRLAGRGCSLGCAMPQPQSFVRRSFMTLAAVVALAVATPGSAKADHEVETILPLRIERVVEQNGKLVAMGSLGETTFTSQVELSVADVSQEGLINLLEGIENPDAVCEILSLELQAIHLDLLGLQVDTSDICLLVAAEEGDGKLLGNLLCDVAGLLNTGGPVDQILELLDEEELQAITDLLNAALAEATSPASVVGVSGTKPKQGMGSGKGQAKGKDNSKGFNKECDILNLAVGPVDLTLLGLNVYLDDCSDGPVTVDITALPGQGKLLGNLLCGVAGLLDGGSLLDAALGKIADEIRNLL